MHPDNGVIGYSLSVIGYSESTNIGGDWAALGAAFIFGTQLNKVGAGINPTPTAARGQSFFSDLTGRSWPAETLV